VIVLRPEGRLDLATAGELKECVATTVSGSQARLVIDLADVPFIDSSGLGALISGLKSARLAGGDLRIANPSEQAKLILQLTALERVMRPYSSLEEALADF
jgi:anti-anti-sigma factor